MKYYIFLVNKCKCKILLNSVLIFLTLTVWILYKTNLCFKCSFSGAKILLVFDLMSINLRIFSCAKAFAFFLAFLFFLFFICIKL